MKYESFTIYEYRGITKPITIDLSKRSIVPIIGVNECGKTTILEAILAFDQFSDGTNNGRHLEDTENLTSFEEGSPRVGATISATRAELTEVIDGILPRVSDEHSRALDDLIGVPDPEIKVEWSDLESISEESLNELPAGGFLAEARKLVSKAKERREILNSVQEKNTISIVRHLHTKKYECVINGLEMPHLQADCAGEVLGVIDYILYFDDFRHDVPPEIPLSGTDDWTGILRNLFKRTDSALSLGKLPSMDPRRRKSAIARAEELLNKTLTRQWERFHLEDRDLLEIKMSYNEASETVSFEVTEAGDSRRVYFNIKDRSKGFFWFFNFVMRLEFNPKVAGGGEHTVYLLDEPGSYLHSLAQDQLCEKLRELSETNFVIYCTHSPHLLSPRTIPFNSIHVVERAEGGTISLSPVTEYGADDYERQSAFQPVIEALQVRPSVFDISSGRVILTEGLYDYFAFELMKPWNDVIVVPAVGAGSIRYHISLHMAWRVDYFALWDNDPEGRAKKAEAEKYFGEDESRRHFRLLPMRPGSRASKRILQDLFHGDDLRMLRRELGLPPNSGFRKVVLAWYYSPLRRELHSKISGATKGEFERLFQQLWA